MSQCITHDSIKCHIYKYSVIYNGDNNRLAAGLKPTLVAILFYVSLTLQYLSSLFAGISLCSLEFVVV